MRTTILIVLLCLIALSFCKSRYRSGRRPYWGYNKYGDQYGKSRTTGLTWDGRTCPIENGCIKLPDLNDLLTRAEFEQQIVGRSGNVMYRIEHFPLGVFHRQECTFSVEGNSVFVDFRARLSGGDCLYLEHALLGNYASTTHAFASNSDVEYPGIPEKQNPMYYFMSDNPTEYYLLFTCLERSTMRNGYCEGQYYVDIVLYQNPPNSPPFWKIEEELCRKLGLRMDDPLNKFLYVGEGCPDP